MEKKALQIPADVPTEQHETYRKHYYAITRGVGRLFLFTADQKIEHLNKDFFGPDITPEARSIEHAFSIAKESKIGAFSTHVGTIARYGNLYPSLYYLAKLDGKTNLAPGEPFSEQLWSVDEALKLKEQSNLTICGVGYTVYVGSEFERDMLVQAAHIVSHAHQHGLVAILWMYPRGKNVTNPFDPDVIAGAAGLCASLGADCVKINFQQNDIENLKQTVDAAGNTLVVCSGGEKTNPQQLIKRIHCQLHTAGAAGGAIGRNIFQRPRNEAIALANTIASVIYENLPLENALAQLEKS